MVFNLFGIKKATTPESESRVDVTVTPLFCKQGQFSFMLRIKCLTNEPIALSMLRHSTDVILDGKWWHWVPRRLFEDVSIPQGDFISWPVHSDDLFVKLDDRFVHMDNTALPAISEPLELPLLPSGSHSIQFRVALKRSELTRFHLG